MNELKSILATLSKILPDAIIVVYTPSGNIPKESAVKSGREIHGLRGRERILWSPKEDAYLNDNPGKSLEELAAGLPGRTKAAINYRRHIQRGTSSPSRISVKSVAKKDINEYKEQVDTSNEMEVPKHFIREESMRVGSFVWHDAWKTGVVKNIDNLGAQDRCIVCFGKSKEERSFLMSGCLHMYKEWLSKIGGKKLVRVDYPTRNIL